MSDNPLNIIATPIGNLEDITLRALNVLKSSDYIFCEDTRVTKKLLDKYDITGKTLKVYNDHSSEETREYIAQLIDSGNVVSLVSDAGTPLISDPGYKLVRYLQEKDISVTTIPGASSVISALTIAGLPTDNFYFGGFLPQKIGQKENFFQNLKHIKSTLIFFDRANRVEGSLEAMVSSFGDVEVAIVREITKLYEEVIRNKVSNLLENDKIKSLKGEVVLLIDNSNVSQEYSDEDIEEEMKKLLVDNSIKDASRLASEKFSIPKKKAYSKLLEISEKLK